MAADVLLQLLADEEPALLDHAREVAGLAAGVSLALGLDRRTREAVARAAELHDIGKLAIPVGLLAKRGPLATPELEVMRRHTVVGEAMISGSPTLRPAAALVRASHERWDGRGYPDGLSGEAIPLGARIVAVCDAFSAMREERPYGSVLTDDEAVAELRRCAGTQFDPRVVHAFCHAYGASAVAV
jgi:HD-GYP domain-containing protein (c-di-GMP phosphodiesterase class II)